MKDWQKFLVVLFGMSIVILCALLLAGCKTQQPQVVEKIVTNTEYIDRWQYDSIYIDKVEYIDRGGDTIVKEKVRTEYRYKIMTDSVEVLKVDSIPYEVKVIDVIERMNNHQRTMYWIGWSAIAIVIGSVIWKIAKFIKL